MGRLFDIVEEYRARFSPHEPSYSQVAQQLGVSRTTVGNWRTPSKLPDKEHMVALADLVGVAYERVLDAALEDMGYLRRNQTVPVSTRRAKRSLQLVEATSSEDVAAHDSEGTIEEEQEASDDA